MSNTKYRKLTINWWKSSKKPCLSFTKFIYQKYVDLTI